MVMGYRDYHVWASYSAIGLGLLGTAAFGIVERPSRLSKASTDWLEAHSRGCCRLDPRGRWCWSGPVQSPCCKPIFFQTPRRPIWDGADLDKPEIHVPSPLIKLHLNSSNAACRRAISHVDLRLAERGGCQRLAIRATGAAFAASNDAISEFD